MTEGLQMPNDFTQYFNELLTALHAEEAEQKKRYNCAIDIEDMAEFTAVTIDAQTKIQRLRKWIEDLQRINHEVETVFPDERLDTQESVEILAAIMQQSANAIIQVDEEDTPFNILIEPEVEQTVFEESVVMICNDEPVIDSPKKFILLGKPYSVNSWQELITKLCEALLLKKPYKLATLSVAPLPGISEQITLSLDEQQIKEPRTKLSNGFFVTAAGSPNEIKIRCECILKACGYSSDVLQIC
jgi:hypothetical protein